MAAKLLHSSLEWGCPNADGWPRIGAGWLLLTGSAQCPLVIAPYGLRRRHRASLDAGQLLLQRLFGNGDVLSDLTAQPANVASQVH